MNKSFVAVLSVAASAYLCLTGCGSDSSCVNDKNPNGTVCSQSSGHGASYFGSSGGKGLNGESSGGFGEAHGGGAAGEAGG